MDEPQPGSAAAVLEIGERLLAPPSERLVATAFAEEVSGQAELVSHLYLVDIAHCLTLAETGVIPQNPARQLLCALLDLHDRRSEFTPGAEFGDLYTNHEASVARVTKAVGWLGTSRARREALTTAYHLLVRARILAFGSALANLGRVLAETAVEHADDPMPDYTYLQAAQPTTFGHYLAGFAWPVLRDLERLQSLYARADLCPAGCGSMNGSVARQDRAALARRLGCSAPVAHARDAMWQADLAIEAMAIATASAVGLDRLGEDLMIFATGEFGLIQLSDSHARASKIMPQKRNPFALSYFRGLANRLIGEQAGVAASGRTPTGQMDSRMLPYKVLPTALSATAQAAELMAEVVSGLSFDAARGRALLSDGSAFASDLAERLCLGLKIDFRSAHGLVGRLITELEGNGRTLASLTEDELRAACRALDEKLPPLPEGLLGAALDPAACVAARGDIGGAAPQEVRRQGSELAGMFSRHAVLFQSHLEAGSASEDKLLHEARAMAGTNT